MSFREAIERQKDQSPLTPPQIVDAGFRVPGYKDRLMKEGLKVLNEAGVPEVLADLANYLLSEGVGDVRLGHSVNSAGVYPESGLVTMGAFWNFRVGGPGPGHAWYGVSISSLLFTEDLLVNRSDQKAPIRVEGEVLTPERWGIRANLEDALARAYKREPHFIIPPDFIPDQTDLPQLVGVSPQR